MHLEEDVVMVHAGLSPAWTDLAATARDDVSRFVIP